MSVALPPSLFLSFPPSSPSLASLPLPSSLPPPSLPLPPSLSPQDYGDLHVLAVSLLALCLVNADSMVALQRSGCLQQLLGHITDSTNTEMKRNAVRRRKGGGGGGVRVVAASILSMCLIILQAKALAIAARNGKCMLLTLIPHTLHSLTPYTPSHSIRAAVNQKILHEQEVEKTFIELLSSEVGLSLLPAPSHFP